MSVAILGGLGLYVNKGSGSSASLATLGASTSSSTSSNSSNQPSPSSTSAVSSSSSSTSNNSSSSGYKDGTFDGRATDTPYGTVQVAAVISGGKITNINFLQMPFDQGHSQEVTSIAGPMLKQETLQAQSARISFISGATSTSNGYVQSLQAALDKAAV